VRLPRLRFTISWMMIAVAALGVASWAFARYQRWNDYDSGWWEAECELWRGEVTIYKSEGLTPGDICSKMRNHICRIDQDTGLPVERIGGCLSEVGDDERTKGHNDHVAQYIRWHGLPKNTLKPWISELFNLARFFDDRSRIDVPKRLVPGGPALVSPDGRNSVRLVGGRRSDSLEVVITAGDVPLGNWYIRADMGDSDLLWGPEGSRFAVIRSITEYEEHYEAHDLRTGRHLRDESRFNVKWPRQREPSNALANLRFVR